MQYQQDLGTKLMSKGRKRKGGGIGRNFFIGLALLVLCFAVLVRLAQYTLGVQDIPYSQFVQEVERGQVTSATMAGQAIHAHGKDEKSQLYTIAPKNAPVWDLFRRHNVIFRVVNTAGQLNMWYLLFGLLLLMILLLAVWYATKQMRGSGGMGGNNIFTMGKSRAKMFLPSAIKDNFNSVAGADEAKEELQDLVDFLKNPEKYKLLAHAL